MGGEGVTLPEVWPATVTDMFGIQCYEGQRPAVPAAPWLLPFFDPDAPDPYAKRPIPPRWYETQPQLEGQAPVLFLENNQSTADSEGATAETKAPPLSSIQQPQQWPGTYNGIPQVQQPASYGNPMSVVNPYAQPMNAFSQPQNGAPTQGISVPGDFPPAQPINSAPAFGGNSVPTLPINSPQPHSSLNPSYTPKSAPPRREYASSSVSDYQVSEPTPVSVTKPGPPRAPSILSQVLSSPAGLSHGQSPAALSHGQPPSLSHIQPPSLPPSLSHIQTPIQHVQQQFQPQQCVQPQAPQHAQPQQFQPQ